MRYFTRPQRSYDEDDWAPPPIITNVTVSDHVAIDTGLVDVDGNSIMRAPNPMGFGKDDEW